MGGGADPAHAEMARVRRARGPEVRRSGTFADMSWASVWGTEWGPSGAFRTEGLEILKVYLRALRIKVPGSGIRSGRLRAVPQSKRPTRDFFPM